MERPCAPPYGPVMRIRVIDAFTDRPFAGNPAAVVILDCDRWPDETWMQRVAAEMNLSETAFAHPLPAGGEADFALRWFTPVHEVNLCGHATLATAHALAADGRAPGGTVRFASRSGVLLAHTGDGGTSRRGTDGHSAPRADRDGRGITLDFPTATPTVATVPDGLAEALGAKPDALYGTGALGDLLAPYADEATVRGLTPDPARLARITRREGIRGVIVTAAAGDGAPYDFVSRMFAPTTLGGGSGEDPVTGSAHTALAPYWSARFGRDELTGLQVSARTGLVRTALHGARVHLTGQAVTVLDGDLKAVAT